jgi:uncharacterized protein YgiM (DUF1202 family)
MGRHDSTDCPDSRTNQRNTTPARRAGVLTAAMSLALLTAAGAAVAAPQGAPSAPVALGTYGASSSQPANFSADPVALSDREAAARTVRSSRSATRGPIPASDATPETTDPAVDALADPAAALAADPAAVPTPAAEPEPEIVGSRYTEVALKVRKTPDADADVVTVLDAADKVKITDVTEDGFRQIIYKDKTRWVKAEFLSKSKPEASTSGGLSTAPCASGSGVEGGIGANAIAAHRAICARFPQVTAYGGYRGGSANHSSGRALDVMVSGAAGWDIANWARANASALGITEVIHAQKIWTTQRAGDGWRGMSDRGSATANHYDHVHLSFR